MAWITSVENAKQLHKQVTDVKNIGKKKRKAEKVYIPIFNEEMPQPAQKGKQKKKQLANEKTEQIPIAAPTTAKTESQQQTIPDSKINEKTNSKSELRKKEEADKAALKKIKQQIKQLQDRLNITKLQKSITVTYGSNISKMAERLRALKQMESEFNEKLGQMKETEKNFIQTSVLLNSDSQKSDGRLNDLEIEQEGLEETEILDRLETLFQDYKKSIDPLMKQYVTLQESVSEAFARHNEIQKRMQLYVLGRIE